jgi:hypothetical protein
MNVKWLREQIAVVEQTTTLFDGTIFENIAICKDGATLQDVQEAAKLVSTTNFESLDGWIDCDYRPTHTSSSCHFLTDMILASVTMETSCRADNE